MARGIIMHNKITEIIESLIRVEEIACCVGFDLEAAMLHTRLIKELKTECDANNIVCRELLKTMPLARIDDASLLINS
jgi:hypothetical protein